MEKFVLEEGTVSVSNTELKLEFEKYKATKKDIFMWIFFIAFVLDHYYDDFRDGVFPGSIWNYFKVVLFTFVGFMIIFKIYHFIFKKNFKSKIVINDIQKIKIDEDFDNDHILEADIIRNNGRIQTLKFRKLKNQLEPFLETIKKRNTRVIIKDN